MSVRGNRAALAIKTRITTPDVDATRAFYERVLGMAVIETWDDPGDRGVILALSSSAREGLLEIYDGPASALDGLSLQFKVDDLAAFTDALPSGMPYDGPTARPWGSTYVYLRDPNGVQVVVYSGGWQRERRRTPVLPGLVSYGRTLDEAREMAQDAVTVHLRGLVKDGEDVPEDPFASGQPIAEELEVTVETMPPKLATLRAVAGSSTKRAVHMLS